MVFQKKENSYLFLCGGFLVVLENLLYFFPYPHLTFLFPDPPFLLYLLFFYSFGFFSGSFLSLYLTSFPVHVLVGILLGVGFFFQSTFTKEGLFFGRFLQGVSGGILWSFFLSFSQMGGEVGRRTGVLFRWVIFAGIGGPLLGGIVPSTFLSPFFKGVSFLFLILSLLSLRYPLTVSFPKGKPSFSLPSLFIPSLIFLSAQGIHLLDGSLPYRWKEWGFSEKEIGVLLTTPSLFIALLLPTLGRFSDRRPTFFLRALLLSLPVLFLLLLLPLPPYLFLLIVIGVEIALSWLHLLSFPLFRLFFPLQNPLLFSVLYNSVYASGMFVSSTLAFVLPSQEENLFVLSFLLFFLFISLSLPTWYPGGLFLPLKVYGVKERKMFMKETICKGRYLPLFRGPYDYG